MNEFGEIVVDMDCENCGVKLTDNNASCASLGEGLCQECEHNRH